MMLGELIAGLDVKLLTPGASAVRVCDITEDSRTAMPGSLFVARAGTKADGRAYALDAVRSGASAVLTDDAGPLMSGTECPAAAIAVARDVLSVSALMAERFYGDPTSRLTLAGVTGTNGKTTISWLVWQILNDAQHRCGLVGTVVVDDGTEVAPAVMTTPPAIELSRTFGRMLEAGCVAGSMEVSSHSLDQGRVAGLRFKIAAFTNLTQDHLDYHGTMEVYAAAKATLFAMLPSDGVAVMNADDPASERMLAECPARAVRCSLVSDEPRGSVAAGQVRIDATNLHGMNLTLAGPFGSATTRVPMVGRYNAMNVLQAACVAHAMGVPGEEVVKSLSALSAPPGRLERVTDEGDPFAIYVDYAHTDDGLRSVLTASREAMRGGDIPGRLGVVFGCGGDRDKTKRPKMGKAAADHADMVFVTSDNPRTESPSSIIDMIRAGMTDAQRASAVVNADRAAAIARAVEWCRSGDVLVIAGKGHETEQVLPDGSGGTLRVAFDDRVHARGAIAARKDRP